MALIISLVQNITLLFMVIIALGFLITFHEFGHFVFAKLFNVSIPSFSIGFGPRLIEKKIGETTFAISAIPLGGYVETAGNEEIGQGEQKEAKRSDERSLSQKPYWQKVCIVLGGILFNIIFSLVALTLLFKTGAPGIPTSSEMIIGQWAEKNEPIVDLVPAKASSTTPFIKGDKILSINNSKISTIQEAIAIAKDLPEKTVPVLIERNGAQQEINITVTKQQTKDGTSIGYLPVFWYIKPLSFTESIKEGFNTTISLMQKTFSALTSLFSRDGAKNVGGPIMIIYQLKEGVKSGFKFFIFLLAFISINLAVLNIIPLPILDGGQLLFFTIEAIIGRQLSEVVRYKIHYYTWLAMIGLVVYLTYKDIMRLLGLN